MYEVVSQRLKRCPQHELCCKSFALCPIVSYSFLQRGNFLIHCSKTTTMRKLLAKNFRPNLELLYIHNFVAKTLANEFLLYSRWPVTSLNKCFRLFLNFPQKTSFFSIYVTKDFFWFCMASSWNWNFFSYEIWCQSLLALDCVFEPCKYILRFLHNIFIKLIEKSTKTAMVMLHATIHNDDF